MAFSKTIIKHSEVPGAVPTIDFLQRGELALNIPDGKLYYEGGTPQSPEVISFGLGANQSPSLPEAPTDDTLTGVNIVCYPTEDDEENPVAGAYTRVTDAQFVNSNETWEYALINENPKIFELRRISDQAPVTDFGIAVTEVIEAFDEGTGTKGQLGQLSLVEGTRDYYILSSVDPIKWDGPINMGGLAGHNDREVDIAPNAANEEPDEIVWDVSLARVASVTLVNEPLITIKNMPVGDFYLKIDSLSNSEAHFSENCVPDKSLTYLLESHENLYSGIFAGVVVYKFTSFDGITATVSADFSSASDIVDDLQIKRRLQIPPYQFTGFPPFLPRPGDIHFSADRVIGYAGVSGDYMTKGGFMVPFSDEKILYPTVVESNELKYQDSEGFPLLFPPPPHSIYIINETPKRIQMYMGGTLNDESNWIDLIGESSGGGGGSPGDSGDSPIPGDVSNWTSVTASAASFDEIVDMNCFFEKVTLDDLPPAVYAAATTADDGSNFSYLRAEVTPTSAGRLSWGYPTGTVYLYMLVPKLGRDYDTDGSQSYVLASTSSDELVIIATHAGQTGNHDPAGDWDVQLVNGTLTFETPKGFIDFESLYGVALLNSEAEKYSLEDPHLGKEVSYLDNNTGKVRVDKLIGANPGDPDSWIEISNRPQGPSIFDPSKWTGFDLKIEGDILADDGGSVRFSRIKNSEVPASMQDFVTLTNHIVPFRGSAVFGDTIQDYYEPASTNNIYCFLTKPGSPLYFNSSIVLASTQNSAEGFWSIMRETGYLNGNVQFLVPFDGTAGVDPSAVYQIIDPIAEKVNIDGSNISSPADWRTGLGLGTAATKSTGTAAGQVPEIINDPFTGANVLPLKLIPTSIIMIASFIDYTDINQITVGAGNDFGYLGGSGYGSYSAFTAHRLSELSINYDYDGEMVMAAVNGRAYTDVFYLSLGTGGPVTLTTYGDPLSIYGMSYVDLSLGSSEITVAETFINSMVFGALDANEIPDNGTLTVHGTALAWTPDSADARTALTIKGWSIVLDT